MKRKSIHPRKKQKIFERDNFKCVNCGVNGDFNVLELDHIVSIKDGGTNDDSNLQTLCYKCNMAKYHKKNITNKFLLNLNPLERLELIKKRLDEYKHLSYSEFKLIFTQDELFKRLRLNIFDIKDLFYDISINKKDKKDKRELNSHQKKFKEQRDLLISLIKKKLGLSYRELSNFLKEERLSLSYVQLRDICTKFGDLEEK